MKNLSQTLSKHSNLLLVLFFIIAVILRWWYLPKNAVSFAYDQGRDAFVVQEILHGHLKILGPPVSGVPGLFHGVLYYYVIAPAYLLGHGNPIIVAYFLSFVSSLGVIIIYFLARLLTKEKVPALIASLIFAFSFESSQYANLLTNASIGVWFVPIFYLGLYLWINKKYKFAPLITGLGFGLAVQSEVALFYHFFPLIFWIIIFRKQISKKDLLLFFTSFIVAISSMIIAEVKFHFTGTRGILYLLSIRDGISQTKTFGNYLATIASQSGKTFAYSLLPQSVLLGGLVGFLMIVIAFYLNFKEIKKKILTPETFLISWIFAYTLALPFGGWNMRHILVGVAPAVAIFAGMFIWKYFRYNKILFIGVILIILVANLAMILKENKNGQTLFPLQPDLTLQNEIGVVDYTYKKTNGAEFSISSLTNPLYINTLWSYLYNWYGVSKYGYLPYYLGRDQIGQLGDNLRFAPSNTTQHFFIIEPTYGIPDLYVTYALGDQNAISDYVSRASFGQLIVEERQIKKNEYK